MWTLKNITDVYSKTEALTTIESKQWLSVGRGKGEVGKIWIWD